MSAWRLRLHDTLSIAYLLVQVGPGTVVEIDLFGAWVSGVVPLEPLFDATGDRVRG